MIKVNVIFKDGTKFTGQQNSGHFSPEETLYDLYDNYKRNNEIKGINNLSEPFTKKYKDIKTITVDFD